ncbi:MAG: serine hydrolase [Gemmatimonadales bacterium]|nr:serine hydrolase [Gemmatimonadales bacterium]NIN10683.1 serine hydrolase [Gemmatimonadales bacterium]NIN49011.1 serine hydrolase [Gemmatimonadales bacterium]NIP06475.1 serine hydrolase [Gemmatimonadales bacterium]NIQ98820.1 serine hydrolase [Gemmatimonadales bacterium]
MQTRSEPARRASVFGLVLAVLLAAPGASLGQAAGERVPGDHWMRYADVEQAGFDVAKLAAARETWDGLPSSAFMVIADGAVVAAWGEVERRFMCHSVRKSFLTALYGIYWDRGEIELNKTLADLGIDDEPDPLLETEKRARILDLLKARSGVFHPAAYAGRTDTRPRGSEGPGRYFAYNNWDFNTAATILMQATGADVFEAFDEYFGQPLQMEDWRVSDGYYHYERDKSKYPAYPFRVSARDAARFGLLYARDGMWHDQRILSEHWVRRSSALYSIDSEIMGYGFMWWVMREPRFTRHGMFAALGVGNQMIAVLPKTDMVIVNRANTYQGEGTPMPALLDLIEQVLEARTGAPVADPRLVPLEVGSDPKITQVSNDRLEEFLGEWDFPPSPLGLPPRMKIRITAGEGHLVAFAPLAGTFKLYLQEDGSLHMEDSRERYVPVRDGAGSFVGIADASSIVRAALTAAADGSSERAERLLAMVEGDESMEVGVGRALVDLLDGNPRAAERGVRQLAERSDPARIEREVNAVGYALLRTEKAEQALAVFELNTRVFPEAFNTWDSLAEAHMVLGHDEEAIRFYERSLELNPNNENAKTMMARIRARQRN